MKRILITGGLGFIGGRLSKKLSNEFEIVVSTRNQVSDDILRLHGISSQIEHSKLLNLSSFPN